MEFTKTLTKLNNSGSIRSLFNSSMGKFRAKIIIITENLVTISQSSVLHQHAHTRSYMASVVFLRCSNVNYNIWLLIARGIFFIIRDNTRTKIPCCAVLVNTLVLFICTKKFSQAERVNAPIDFVAPLEKLTISYNNETGKDGGC